VPSKPVDTRSMHPHSQIAVGSSPVRSHDDSEVVLGLGSQTVGVHQLEAGLRLEGVPLVDVPVYEHGALVVVGGRPAVGTGEGVVDRRLGTGPAEPFPLVLDETGEPSSLVGPGLQALVGPGLQALVGFVPPHPGCGVAEDCVSCLDVEAELDEWPPEALEEERPSCLVVLQQLGTAVAGDGSKDADLVAHVIAGAIDVNLEHSLPALAGRRLGDEGLGSMGETPADRDAPELLEVGDDGRQVVQPAVRARCEGLVADHLRYLEHVRTVAQPPPRAP
jgi:hypothetical protein